LTAEEVGVENLVVSGAIKANDHQKLLMVKKIESLVGNLNGKTIALLGLAFKPNTDDIRDATSLVIIEEVLKAGGKIKAYDPVAQEAMSKIYPRIEYCQNEYETAKNADCLVIVTEWNEFRELNMPRLKEILKSPKIVDCRNIYDPAEMIKLGFAYEGVGRGKKHN